MLSKRILVSILAIVIFICIFIPNSLIFGESLPSSVDNSLLPYFPPIRNQGDIGSCGAFSSTYYQMTYMTAMAKGWNTKDDSDNTNKFSPKWTYTLCNAGVIGSGAMPGVVYSLIQSNGCATWADFPYVGNISDPKNSLEWSTNPAVWRNALNYKLDKMGSVDFTPPSINPTIITNPNSPELIQIKQLLYNGYILEIGTPINSWYFTTVKNNPSTVADDSYVGQQVGYFVDSFVNGPHGVVIVGYNDDIWVDINENGTVDPGEKGAFKIANSWGSSWGNNGFIWLAYDAVNKVSSVNGGPAVNRGQAFTGVMWMTVKPSYTPKLLAQITLSHAKRNQLAIAVGYSDITQTKPTTTINSFAINFDCGEWAFDGTTVPCDGTFVLDLSELDVDNSLNDGVARRWYIKVTDKSADGYPAIIKDFKLIDPVKNITVNSTDSFPTQIDGATKSLGINYTLPTMTPVSTPWSFKADVTTPRTGFGIASFNNKIYIMGGSDGKAYINTVEEYDPVRKTWVMKANMKQFAKNIKLAVANNKIYSIGGFDGNNFLKTIDEYDPSTDSWITKTTLPYDNWMIGGVAAVNNKIYIMGGNYNNIIMEYDPVANTLQTKATPPISICAFDCTVLGGKIYLIGINIGNGDYPYRVEEYNPATDNWTPRTNVPIYESTGFRTITFNNKIYVFFNNTLLNQIAIYDPLTGSWAIDGNMPQLRSTFEIAGCEGKIYVVSGTCTGDLDVTGTVEVYSPTTSIPTPTPIFTPTPTVTPTPTPISVGNLLSQGKPVSASTVQNGNTTANANDGNTSTRWSAGSSAYPQWWKVDLGTNYNLTKVDISWYSSSSRAYKYKIEGSSDGSTYTNLVDKTGNTNYGDTSDSFTANGRYVRIIVTGCSVGSGYASAYEIKVYGTSGSVTPTPTLTPTPTPTVTPTSTPTPAVTPMPILLSQYMMAFASSYQSGANQYDGNTPANANDGVASTRWSASSNSYPQWWKVDLNTVQNLSRVDIDWYNNNNQVYKYKIEVSNDDIAYTTIVDKTGNTTYGSTSDSFTTTGRRVRVTITGCTDSSAYASGYEIKVYGPSSSVTPAPTSTPTPTPTVTPTSTPTPTATPTSKPTSTPTSTATPTPTVIPTSTVTPTPTGTSSLLSQGMTSSASTYQAGNTPANANDGSTTTRWSASSGSYPQWWLVDLGTTKNLSKVDINWYNSSNRAYKYKIETSNDNNTFTTIIDKTGNTTYGDTSDSFTAIGRYVRITVTGSTSGAAYASFYECKVYGN